MPWEKGQSGNPRGRQKGIRSEAEKLRQAMRKVENERDVDFYQHFCERAFEDNQILVALMKKFVPDMKQIDSEVNMNTNVGVITLPAVLPPGAPVPDIDEGQCVVTAFVEIGVHQDVLVQIKPLRRPVCEESRRGGKSSTGGKIRAEELGILAGSQRNRSERQHKCECNH